jgi:hypothetical protein
MPPGKVMAGLRLSAEVLSELTAAFNGFGDLLYRACAGIRAGDAAVTGDAPLAGEVHGFTGSWNYGLGQLGQHGHDCAAQLQKVNATFGQLEKQAPRYRRGSKPRLAPARRRARRDLHPGHRGG